MLLIEMISTLRPTQINLIQDVRIAVLGAGIAGLSAAHFLRDRVDRLDIFEASSHIGGIARSFSWHGFDCDIASHRLFTTDQSLVDELCMLVPMHRVRRRSRILLRERWLRDPVNAVELLAKFFPRESLAIVRSYLQRPAHKLESFKSLALSQYGQALYDLFFAPYSEKLFGIAADEISPVWGQKKLRMGGLRDILWRRSKLYFRSFLYPNEGGYGAIVERLTREVRTRISINTRVVGLERLHNGGESSYRCMVEDKDGRHASEYDAVISTLPAPYLVEMLGGKLDLEYRKAMLSYLLLNKPQMSANHWIYFADRERLLNRVAEFKHFGSVNTIPEKTVVCCESTDLGEYSMDRVISELGSAGLLKTGEVEDTTEIHLSEGYPIYDLTYERKTSEMREFLSRYPGLHILGRQATFIHRDTDEIYADAKIVAEQVLDHPKARPY